MQTRDRFMTFREALKDRDFAVTAQLNLAAVKDRHGLVDESMLLKPYVDAIHLPDEKQAHISNVAAAALLLQNGIDPVVHMNCRDRNRIAMQKDLLGVAALGVTSVLVTRGGKIPHSKKLGIRNVYDTPALEFMAYIQGLKNDELTSLDTDFLVGANAELFDAKPDWVPKNLIRKCDAGTNFVQLQLCFDLHVARNYMARIVASKLTRRVHFVMALSPLPSAEIARWVRDNVKGALVPDAVIERLERSDDPEHEGIEICAELMREVSGIPGVSGISLLSMGNLDSIPAAIRASGVRDS